MSRLVALFAGVVAVVVGSISVALWSWPSGEFQDEPGVTSASPASEIGLLAIATFEWLFSPIDTLQRLRARRLTR